MNSQLFQSVLVVEDEPAHALLIQRALREFCSDLQHVESLAAARECLKGCTPDLVITDLNLRDATRLASLKQLTLLVPDTPIIVLTSSTSLQDAVEAMKLGAKDFIVKDFGPNFREMLGLALSRVRTAQMLEEERNRLRREMEALRTSIENSRDGLAVIGGTGEVLYSNHSFDEFVRNCGGKRSKLRELFSEQVEDCSQLQSSVEDKFAHLEPGAVWHTEIKLRDDKHQAYDLSLSVIRPAGVSGAGNECVLWVRDTSEQKRKDKFQREILATTTHDLKNPLATIRLSAELLVDMVKEVSRASDVALRIQASAETALNMIDEFLSARRIQEGTYILKPTPQNVTGLVDEVLGGFEASAAAQGIELRKTYSGSDIVWQIDRLGFTRVLSNLLSNAIKFSRRGGKIEVRVRVAGPEFSLAVADTGRGMEPSEVQRIFERFSRLERHADVPGTGIGLFVVKSIVSAHGGKIEVTSAPEKGTTFEVIFPKQLPVNAQGELISLDFA